jgi:hypothetical protein
MPLSMRTRAGVGQEAGTPAAISREEAMTEAGQDSATTNRTTLTRRALLGRAAALAGALPTAAFLASCAEASPRTGAPENTPAAVPTTSPTSRVAEAATATTQPTPAVQRAEPTPTVRPPSPTVRAEAPRTPTPEKSVGYRQFEYAVLRFQTPDGEKAYVNDVQKNSSTRRHTPGSGLTRYEDLKDKSKVDALAAGIPDKFETVYKRKYSQYGQREQANDAIYKDLYNVFARKTDADSEWISDYIAMTMEFSECEDKRLKVVLFEDESRMKILRTNQQEMAKLFASEMLSDQQALRLKSDRELRDVIIDNAAYLHHWLQSGFGFPKDSDFAFSLPALRGDCMPPVR